MRQLLSILLYGVRNDPVNSQDPSGHYLDAILDGGFKSCDVYRIACDNVFESRRWVRRNGKGSPGRHAGFVSVMTVSGERRAQLFRNRAGSPGTLVRPARPPRTSVQPHL